MFSTAAWFKKLLHSVYNTFAYRLIVPCNIYLENYCILQSTPACNFKHTQTLIIKIITYIYIIICIIVRIFGNIVGKKKREEGGTFTSW